MMLIENPTPFFLQDVILRGLRPPDAPPPTPFFWQDVIQDNMNNVGGEAPLRPPHSIFWQGVIQDNMNNPL